MTHAGLPFPVHDPGRSHNDPYLPADRGHRLQPKLRRSAAMRAGAVRERRLRNVITEGLGVVLDRRCGVTTGTRGALPGDRVVGELSFRPGASNGRGARAGGPSDDEPPGLRAAGRAATGPGMWETPRQLWPAGRSRTGSLAARDAGSAAGGPLVGAGRPLQVYRP